MEVVFGTMTFGPRLNEEETKVVLDECKALGVKELDTALMYGGGKTEEILGNLAAGTELGFTIATKANPFRTTPQPVEVGLSPEQVNNQLTHSLGSLKMDKVELFYLHAPDHDTDILETLKAVNDLHKAGKFEKFGLSNYASWQVAQIYELCKSHGFVTPSVYQGMYNGVTRQVELELFPCLRAYGIAFYAYNPLAGGVLTGKYNVKDAPTEGRFDTTSMWGQIYRSRYWKEELFEAVEKLRGACEKHGTTVADAAHRSLPYPTITDISNVALATSRWLVHHSSMDASKGDKIIVGASSLEHCRANIAACKGGPLPEEITAIFDEGWEKHSFNVPCYFR